MCSVLINKVQCQCDPNCLFGHYTHCVHPMHLILLLMHKHVPMQVHNIPILNTEDQRTRRSQALTDAFGLVTTFTLTLYLNALERRYLHYIAVIYSFPQNQSPTRCMPYKHTYPTDNRPRLFTEYFQTGGSAQKPQIFFCGKDKKSQNPPRRRHSPRKKNPGPLALARQLHCRRRT